MSQILNMPTVQFSVTQHTNEDWTDAWGYVDGNGNPLPGAGIALIFMLRATVGDQTPWIVAANYAGLISGQMQNGAIRWGGTNGNLIIPAIPQATMMAIPPGAYLGEVLGTGDGLSRVLAEIAFTVEQGLVR